MASNSRAPTSYTSGTTSYPSNPQRPSATPRPGTSMSRATTARPKTRPRTATSTIGGGDQQIICAINESRGLSPIVGLAFINLSTTEAVLCQISDSQTYVQTVHKLTMFEPTEILFANTVAQPPTKLYSIINQEFRNYIRITTVDRKYWGGEHRNRVHSAPGFQAGCRSHQGVSGRQLLCNMLLRCGVLLRGVSFVADLIAKHLLPSRSSSTLS